MSSSDGYTSPALIAQRAAYMQLEDVINRILDEKEVLLRRIKQLEEELNDARGISKKDRG